jgi:hypothetical protein
MMRERFSAPPHLFLQPPKPTASKRAVKAAQRQKNAPELETIWQETTAKGFLLVFTDGWAWASWAATGAKLTSGAVFRVKESVTFETLSTDRTV